MFFFANFNSKLLLFIAEEITTTVPYLKEGWKDFGQIDGNEDIPLGATGGASTTPGLTPEEKAKSSKTAMLTSRINTLLSLPMLLSMVMAQNLY